MISVCFRFFLLICFFVCVCVCVVDNTIEQNRHWFISFSLIYLSVGACARARLCIVIYLLYSINLNWCSKSLIHLIFYEKVIFILLSSTSCWKLLFSFVKGVQKEANKKNEQTIKVTVTRWVTNTKVQIKKKRQKKNNSKEMK